MVTSIILVAIFMLRTENRPPPLNKRLFRRKLSVSVPKRPQRRCRGSVPAWTRPPNLSPRLHPLRKPSTSIVWPSYKLVLYLHVPYKLLEGVVTATNVGIQANTAWKPQKLASAFIISSINFLADAQGTVLERAKKFSSQQGAEKLRQRIQQIGLETTATIQELRTGFQAIIAPALKTGYALEESPELTTRTVQAMEAFPIPIPIDY